MSLFLHVDPFLASVVTDITKSIVFTLFVITAVVLSVVILLQEGKGGGLGSAFGGAAADAFGVKAGTVNKFTSYLATSFLGLALLYSALNSQGDSITTVLEEGAPSVEGILDPLGEEVVEEIIEVPPTDMPPEDAPPTDPATPGDGD